MDLVTELAKELRGLEHMRAASPTEPGEQSIEWAEMRIRALLPTVVERLTSPAAIEEAEPIVERAYEAGFREGKGERIPVGQVRPGLITRDAILAACRRAGVDERPPEHHPPAEVIPDALATALLRCGFEDHEFVCYVAGEKDPAPWAGVVVHPGDRDAYVSLRTADAFADCGLRLAEQMVLEICEAHDVEYVPPSELELAALQRTTVTLGIE